MDKLKKIVSWTTYNTVLITVIIEMRKKAKISQKSIQHLELLDSYMLRFLCFDI